MIIFPAVDIKDGQCVRLFKGDFNTVEKVFESPIASALNFKNEGATHLHLVDLDGSLEKKPINHNIILDVKQKTDMFCEIGGGIRTMDDVDFYLSKGIDRVIIGSSALNNPELVKESVEKYSEKITVGIDAKDELVCAEGWVKSSNVNYIEFAKEMEIIGVNHIIFTDISTDGTLEGPNFYQLAKLQDAVAIKITASGGIRDVSHINKLKEMGLYGAICGKSLYAGTLKLSEIL